MDTNLITETFRNKVKKALINPYLWPEIDNRQKSEQHFAGEHLYGKLSKKEFSRKLKKLESEAPSLIATSLLELEMVMDVLELDEEIKKDTLADMELKYQIAIDKGYQCRFAVWFYKAIPKGLAMYCATQINI